MAKTIKPDNFSAAFEQQLTIYNESVNQKLEAAMFNAMENLVRKTKATAPKKSGDFRKNITSDVKQYEKAKRKAHGGLHGRVFKTTWYVKAPDHRITHLLVHGHAKKNGRVDGDPFLHNALDQVLPEYDKAVREAVIDD